MEEVQLKALELLSQMNNNSQISVLRQNTFWCPTFVMGEEEEEEDRSSCDVDKTSWGFTVNMNFKGVDCFYSC